MAARSDEIQAARMPPSVAATLQSLSNRPNVESTFIISRKDGSIISVTGPASRSTMSTGNNSSYQNTNFRERSESIMASAQHSQDGDTSGDPSAGSREPTYAEKLTASIVDFVDAAASLASNLNMSQSEDRNNHKLDAVQRQPTDGHTAELGTDDLNEARTRDSEVQLLRLRTRRQEVIIYPDANYLCCVVQSAGKYGHNS